MPVVKKDKSVEKWHKLWELLLQKKKKGEITKHTRFLSTSNLDVEVNDGGDDDAAAGDDEDADDFVDTDSDSAVPDTSAPDEDDDTKEDDNGDGESNDNGDADDDCDWSVY